MDNLQHSVQMTRDEMKQLRDAITVLKTLHPDHAERYEWITKRVYESLEKADANEKAYVEAISLE